MNTINAHSLDPVSNQFECGSIFGAGILRCHDYKLRNSVYLSCTHMGTCAGSDHKSIGE